MTREGKLPLVEAIISPSCQRFPHEGQFFPMPIGFEPNKAWLLLEPRHVQVTQILLYITHYMAPKLMYLITKISLFFKNLAEKGT
jgi:hypothetical protein